MSPAADTAAAAANPIAGFYGGGRVVRGLGRVLQAVQRFAPGFGTRAALGLFFTPLPSKRTARRLALPAGWRVERWPFETGSMVVYRRADAEPGRPTVLLVHGWAGHGLQMQALGDAVAAAGANPVLLDLPGHGRSDGWRSTLPQFVRALWAASARLGPLHAVVAHSMGALAASHALAHGLPAKRLALIATSPPPKLVLKWFAHGFGLGAAMSMRMRRLIEQREGIDLEHFEADELAPHLPRATLVVHDEDDRAAPALLARRLADQVAGARWLATRGLGHRRVLADPEVLREVAEHVTRPIGIDDSGQ